MKNIFFVLIAFLGLSSCKDTFSTVLKVDPPEHVKQLAVHAFFTSDAELLKIGISTTVGLLENSRNIDRINNAQAVLFINDQLIGEFKLNPDPDASFYNYSLQLAKPIIEYGNKVELRVTHPDFKTVRAVEEFPPVVQPKKTKFIENAGLDQDGEPASGIEIEIDDPVGRTDFYEVLILALSENSGSEPNVYTVYANSSDPSVAMGANYDDLLVSDGTFDGSNYRLLITFGQWVLDSDSELAMRWSVLSRSQYLYSKSIGALRNADEIGGPFAEPVSIFTNMENGLGVLGLRRTEYIEIER